MDEYDQSGEYQEPEFHEDDFPTTSKPQRFSSKMPKNNAEHQKEWRSRNADKHRAYMREYMAKRRGK